MMMAICRKHLSQQQTTFFSFFPGLLKLDERNRVTPIKAKKITVHPNHTLNEEVFDIAVVELEKAQTLSERVKPICLPGKGAYDFHLRKLSQIV